MSHARVAIIAGLCTVLRTARVTVPDTASGLRAALARLATLLERMMPLRQ